MDDSSVVVDMVVNTVLDTVESAVSSPTGDTVAAEDTLGNVLADKVTTWTVKGK